MSEDRYDRMSDEEIDEHFRMGWLAAIRGDLFEVKYPRAWREGWIKASKLKHEDRDEKTNVSGDCRSRRPAV